MIVTCYGFRVTSLCGCVVLLSLFILFCQLQIADCQLLLSANVPFFRGCDIFKYTEMHSSILPFFFKPGKL